MWIATDIADGFDRLRREDDRILDEVFQGWVDYAVQHEDDPAWYSSLRNAAIYTGSGLLYGGWKLSSTVASGFLDLLRLGDGVQKGGWGYAEDALRLLVFAGPALRIGRYGLAKVASVDMFTNVGNCAWVAAARALRMTGVQHFATLEDLAKAAGLALTELKGLYGFTWLSAILKNMGAATKLIRPTATKVGPALEAALKANPNHVILFPVRWFMNGKWVGHALVAFRHPITGMVRILDRSKEVVGSLAELERFYPNIGQAYIPAEEALLAIKNATTATAVDLLSKSALVAEAAKQLIWPETEEEKAEAKKKKIDAMIDSAPLIKSLGLEVRSVPFRVEPMRRAEIPVKPIILPADIGMVSSTVCTDQYRSIMGDGTETIVTEKKCVSMTYQYKLYRVKKGDSLVRIAKLVYGTENLWKLVYEANRELLGPNPHDPGALRAGMELHIIMSSRRDEWTE